jgi:hypothetical protein
MSMMIERLRMDISVTCASGIENHPFGAPSLNG